MELSELQKQALISLRELIHDDEMNCINILTLLEIEFMNLPEFEFLIGYMKAALNARAKISKISIELLRNYYPYFWKTPKVEDEI